MIYQYMIYKSLRLLSFATQTYPQIKGIKIIGTQTTNKLLIMDSETSGLAVLLAIPSWLQTKYLLNYFDNTQKSQNTYMYYYW